MIRKIISQGEELRSKLRSGAAKIESIVGATIGPKGRNVIISRKYKSPLITNDGVTAARHTYLDDPVEDLAAQVLVEAALKTNEVAGDGTSTATVVGAETFKSMSETIDDEGVLGEGAKDPVSLYKQALEEKNKVVEYLKSIAHEASPEDLRHIISTSLEGGEFVEPLSQMIEKVGKDGHITVRENWATKYEIETELIEGMKFLGTYATPLLINSPAKKEAVFTDVPTLVTNEHIENIAALKPIIEALQAKNIMKLVVFAEKFETSLIRDVNRALQKEAALIAQGKPVNMFRLILVKTPSLISEELEDLAVFTDSKFINKNAQLKVEKAVEKDLGFAAQVIINQDDVIVTGGRGNVAERLEILKQQLETEKDTMFKEKLNKRIASLASGVGTILVGAPTEQERTYLKYKIEDAVNAGKGALEEGWVKGGGLALLEAAHTLGEDAVLFKALQAPYNRIQKNAGGRLEIPEDVIDPVKVTRLAVENGVSAAGALATTESAITEERENLLDLLTKQIQKDEEDDFREYSEFRGGRIED